MKTIKTLLFLSLSILLFSCSDDDDKLDLASLKQSVWKGTLIVGSDSEITRKGSVGLAFYTEDKGYYDLIYEDQTNYTYDENFEYYVNGKLLQIKYGTMISGSWLLVSKNKDTMVLENGTSGNPRLKTTMILKREY